MNPIKPKPIPGLNVKSFPTIPVENKKLLPNNLNESNHLQADADGYLKAVIMNGVSGMPHSKENQSYLLDLMIDEATEALANNRVSFV